MSNMNDVMGLRIPYGNTNAQYETQYEPASGTIWGYFNPRATPCFSPGLLRDIRLHDSALSVNGGKVEIAGELNPVHFYVCGSHTPGNVAWRCQHWSEPQSACRNPGRCIRRSALLDLLIHYSNRVPCLIDAP